MRTTVSIDDELLRRARVLAVESRRSLGAVVDDALRVLLAPRAAELGEPDVEFPIFGGSGLRPGVDLEDKDALARILGDEDFPHASG